MLDLLGMKSFFVPCAYYRDIATVDIHTVDEYVDFLSKRRITGISGS